MAFSAKQNEYLQNATHRWNVKFGATRSGKTFLDFTVIPKRILNTNGTGLIVLLGNTKGTLERNILEPMRNIWGGNLVGSIGSNNTVMLFGKRCHALGADKVSQVAKLQGTGIEYCYGDEVTTWHEDIFNMLKSRLDKPNSCFDGTCNPDGPNHWFKKFLESDVDIYSQGYTLEDNPFLTKEFIENLKKEYAGTVYYDRFIRGLWKPAEGLIYPNQAAGHGVVPSEDRKYIAWNISIDYGTKNPCSMGLWGKFNDAWYRVGESYYDGRETGRPKTDEEYYDMLVRLAGNRRINSVVVDPSAASFIECIKRHGKFSVVPAKNAVLDGIRLTASKFQDGCIKICDNCKDTIQEFSSYRWDEKSGEDKPIKENDHAMDEIRYFVNMIYGGSKIKILDKARLGIY